MGLFGSLFGGGINQNVDEARSTSGSIMLDVRSPEEYRSGHIEGAYNIPISAIGKASSVIKDKDAPLFVYCLSGSRSAMACRELEHMGFSAVTNMGGINRWTGDVVCGGELR